MRNIFRNDRNQVRWGYKLASFLLIQEILGPIAIILVSVALVNLLFPILQASGVLDGDGVGFAIGVVFITIVCGGIYLTGSARIMAGSGLQFSPWLAGYLLMFVFVGFGEEIAFRGYAMGTLRQTEKDWLIVLLPAVLFGIAHSTNANFSLMGCGNIILAGILLGLLALKSGHLWLGLFPGLRVRFRRQRHQHAQRGGDGADRFSAFKRRGVRAGGQYCVYGGAFGGNRRDAVVV